MEHRQLDELVGVRGLLAWWVVIGHIAFVFSDRVGGLIRHTSAVTVFIILSGFVITHLVVTKREAYRIFIIRRFFRVFPAYLVALTCAFLMLDIQKSALEDSLFATARNVARAGFTDEALTNPLQHLLAHLTLLHGLVPPSILPHSDYTILGQAWSISVEWQFYLIAPLLVWLLFRGPILAAATAALMLSLAELGKGDVLMLGEAFMPNHATWFLAGIGSFWLWHNRAWPARRPAAGLGAGLLLVAGLLTRDVGAILWAPILLMLGNVCPRITDPARAILRHRALTWLGKISYSTYLLHMIALYGCMRLAADLTDDRFAYAAIVISGTVPLTVLMSYLSHRFIEVRGSHLGDRLTSGVGTKPCERSPEVADVPQAAARPSPRFQSAWPAAPPSLEPHA